MYGQLRLEHQPQSCILAFLRFISVMQLLLLLEKVPTKHNMVTANSKKQKLSKQYHRVLELKPQSVLLLIYITFP